jgi:hypothetical protein
MIVWWYDTVIPSPCIGIITSVLLPLVLVGWGFGGALLVPCAMLGRY